MKKLGLLGLLAAMFFATNTSIKAQPVSDNAVVPLGVTLNRIMRIKIVNGGNIEFVFNTIDQYTDGIINSAFYDTRFQVAASSNWLISFGAEDATLLGTDQTTATEELNNVGFITTEAGTHTEAASTITDTYGSIGGAAVALVSFPVTLMESGGTGTASNAGYQTENDFTINWECGTTSGTMNATAFIDQDVVPDRYVTNILFTLEDD